jgi:hypothetical protein
MNKCILCDASHTRCKPNSHTLPALYCSTRCVKRASYLRKNPNARSIERTEEFWDTETGIGYKWEIYVANKVSGGEHVPFNKDGVDVVSDMGNLDVKAGEKSRNQWVFNRNRKKPHIDFYYCVCLEGGKPVKELLIPSERISGKVGITVGNKSKYDIYKV